MKLLGLDTGDINLLGKFTITNSSEFPVVVSLWQTGPLYYKVVDPGQTWSTGCGSVWFTVKVWLYNGANNINPGIKYSLLAGNIAGFAALGAFGLTATALASAYGVSTRNPDWEKWLKYNELEGRLSTDEEIHGIASIKYCEYSQGGVYTGKHPHLFVSGGPIRSSVKSDAGIYTSLEWHEFRTDKCAYANDSTPLIRSRARVQEQRPASKIADISVQRDNRHPHAIEQHLISMVDQSEEKPPLLPARPLQQAPAVPSRPARVSTDEKFHYKIKQLRD